jgi:hypothetical protein
MTERPERLSKEDLKFLFGLLSKADDEAIEEIDEGGGDHKAAAIETRKMISRIRLALIDLDRPTNE